MLMDMDRAKLLFICTGNFYRSRFAEALFNHHAEERQLLWRAFSRGLYPGWVTEGELSPHTIDALEQRGIHIRHTGDRRTELTLADLNHAQHVIALKEEEHRPMMLTRFPEFADRITYWSVHDVDQALPEDALGEIETLVNALLDELTAQSAGNKPTPTGS